MSSICTDNHCAEPDFSSKCILERMKESLAIGSKIELILKLGTEFENDSDYWGLCFYGWKGYRATANMRDLPGARLDVRFYDVRVDKRGHECLLFTFDLDSGFYPRSAFYITDQRAILTYFML